MAETFSVFVDTRFDASERRAIGNSIVDYIVNRTKKGKGVGNIPFTNKSGSRSYTKAYQEHRDFTTGGKNNRPINLTLTGDMLDSIEVLDISLTGRIIVGIKDGENADKAKWMREKGYNFLGLSEEEKSIVLAKFAKLTPTEVVAANITENIARQFLRNLLGG